MIQPRQCALSFLSSYRGYWCVIALMCVAYAFKSANPESQFDLVPVAWAIVAAVIFPLVTKKSSVASVLVFVWLFVWYSIGLSNSGFGEDGVALMRLFLSFPLLTAATAFYLAEEGAVRRKSAVSFELFALGLLAAWIIFIYQEQFYVDYAVRAYGATNYLTLSDLVAVLVLVTIFGRPSPIWFRFAWMFLGLLTCLLLGSRTTMVVLVASLLLGTVTNANAGFARRLLALLTVSAVLCAGVVIFASIFDETITFRFLTFFDLQRDTSLEGRGLFFSDYVKRLNEDVSCIFVPCFPDAGQYVHNVLSVHQYFGLGGVVLVLVAFVTVLRALHRGWRPAALPLLFFCAVELVFARAWVSLVFPIFFGYVVSAVSYLNGKYQLREERPNGNI